MTKRETAHLLLKLLVIYAMLQFAPSLLYVIGLLGSINSSPRPQYAMLMLGIALLAPLIWIGLCLLVLRFSGRIAARLMPEEGHVDTLFALSFAECQALGFNFIGLLLIVQSFPQLIQLLSSIRFEGYVTDMAGRVDVYRRILPNVLAFIAQLTIGICLFLRARGLANLWTTLQKARPMRREPDNQTLHATSEPAPGADSSSHEG
jgi:hypothetical protein